DCAAGLDCQQRRHGPETIAARGRPVLWHEEALLGIKRVVARRVPITVRAAVVDLHLAQLPHRALGVLHGDSRYERVDRCRQRAARARRSRTALDTWETDRDRQILNGRTVR